MAEVERYKHKVDWHDWCDQGWIEIKKNTITNKIVFKCSECFTEYDCYENINKEANDPDRRDFFPMELSDNEIKENLLEHLIIKEWKNGKFVRNDGVIIKQWNK
jgi:hypothetical protein